MNVWIAVSDRLPEPLEDVLIVYAGDEGPERDLGYLTRLGKWQLVGLDDYQPAVSHWQPLPALPAELTEATP